jgi:hypothetical protein
VVIKRTIEARIVQLEGWKGATVQRGLDHGSRGIAIVRSRYQETSSEDTTIFEVWKSVIVL